MAEQGPEDEISLVLGGEFFNHFRGALGIGRVVLDNKFDGPPANATRIVDSLGSGLAHFVIPVAIACTNAS